MGLGDLFSANDDWTGQALGSGVSANSVSYFAPDNTETPITSFVFENTTAREFSITPTGDDDGEVGEIDIPLSINVSPRGWFVIDGDVWKYRGRGGRSLGKQTILLKLPKPDSHRQARGRGR